MAHATLKACRGEIAKLQKEIRTVENAIPPVAENEQRLRAYFEMLTASHNRLIEHAAFCLNSGITSELLPMPAMLPEQAYGLGIAALGVDQIVEKARERAAAQDNGALRLSKADREERLLELAHSLYALEVEESGLLGDDCPRPDMNAAAAVGIPANVAEAAGLLMRKV